MKYVALAVVMCACGGDERSGTERDSDAASVATDASTTDTSASDTAQSVAPETIEETTAPDTVIEPDTIEEDTVEPDTVIEPDTVEEDTVVEPDTVEDDTTEIEVAACVPDCGGVTCGPDGCGGTCGECGRWLATFGSVANPNAVAVDAAGRVITMAFGYETALDFGDGPLGCPTDVWVPYVAAWEKTGELAFTRCFTGWELNVDNFGNGQVAVGADQYVVLAGSQNGPVDWGLGPTEYWGGFDAYVVRLSPRGTPLWARVFGDHAYQGVSAVAIDGDNNIVLAIANTGTLEIDRVPHTSLGGTDIVLVKLAPNGDTLWVKDFGDEGLEQVVTGLGIADDGDILLAGTFSGGLDFGGGRLAAPGPDDHSHDDAFIARLTADGDHVWSRQFDSMSCAIHAAGFAGDGSMIVTGTLQAEEPVVLDDVTLAGGISNFVFTFDGDGLARWAYKPAMDSVLPGKPALDANGYAWVGWDPGLTAQVDAFDPTGQVLDTMTIGSSFMMGLSRTNDGLVVIGSGSVSLEVPANPADGRGWVLFWSDVP